VFAAPGCLSSGVVDGEGAFVPKNQVGAFMSGGSAIPWCTLVGVGENEVAIRLHDHKRDVLDRGLLVKVRLEAGNPADPRRLLRRQANTGRLSIDFKVA
jgi:hypothetical protein